MSKKGYSREGLFGDITHYDSKGNKIGSSSPGLFGDYTNYDAKGNKVGHTDQGLFGDYTTYDSKGNKVSSSAQGFDGSYSHYDSSGKKTGTTDPGLLGGYTHSDSEGCYVATCVYGSYDCPQVLTLRRFRDQILAKHLLGRLFIKLYYATSPTAVKLFGNTRYFKSFFRRRLDPLVERLEQRSGFSD